MGVIAAAMMLATNSCTSTQTSSWRISATMKMTSEEQARRGTARGGAELAHVLDVGIVL